MGEVVSFPRQLRVVPVSHDDIDETYICNPNAAFEETIANGHFCLNNEQLASHAIHWLYMYHYKGQAYFKNIHSHEYQSFPSQLTSEGSTP